MRYVLAFALLCCCFASATEVATSDGVTIRSTNTIADLKGGIIVYEGDVLVTHKGIRFRADRIEEHRKNGDRTRVVAIGSPAVYIDELVRPGSIAQGNAKRLEYIAKEGKVLLTDFELQDTQGNINTGKHGVYYLHDS